MNIITFFKVISVAKVHMFSVIRNLLFDAEGRILLYLRYTNKLRVCLVLPIHSWKARFLLRACYLTTHQLNSYNII